MAYRSKELAAAGVSADVIAVRELRRRLKVTQREFAAMAGIHHITFVRFELGEHEATPQTLAKIQALVWQWRLKPPVLEKKVERRGGWNRGMAERTGSGA